MAASDAPARLNPSDLGTKEHWDQVYAREIENHASNPEDEGTVWFEDSGAEEKVLNYLETLPIESSEDADITQNRELRILDLGTGNGHILFELRDMGWQAELVGVDYSESSIELAKNIQKRRVEIGQDKQKDHDESDCSNAITFQCWDILKDPPGDWLRDGFDIVLDKGTFDAISLQDDTASESRRFEDIYCQAIQSLFKAGGYFVVTSCNWTETELKKWFQGDTLRYHESLKYPTFTFGGIKGQSISSVCFKSVLKNS